MANKAFLLYVEKLVQEAEAVEESLQPAESHQDPPTKIRPKAKPKASQACMSSGAMV